MLNQLKPRLLKGSKLSLMIAVIWNEELPLQIGSATAQPACELQPCDCRGPFERPPIEITSEELMKAISAHQNWIFGVGSRLEYWKIEDQIEQYDPAFNLPDGSEGKYLCSKERNGLSLLNSVDLRRSDSDVLSNSDLRGACFRKSDLRRANFNNSKLQGVNFYKADLSGASLVGANLTGAIFDCANLRGADLTGATLAEANLYRALLSGAFANHAQLERARFEPIELPPVRNLWEAQGLEKLRWLQNPSALFALREELRKSGQDHQANRLTYAIEHQITFENLGKWNQDALSAFVGVLRFLFIEWTTGYGLYPFRALGILLVRIVAFAVGYTFSLNSWSGGGVYRIWPEKSLQETGVSGGIEVERLHPYGAAVVVQLAYCVSYRLA